MIGHEIVPHHHDNDLIEHPANSSNNVLNGLENAFSYFQHNTVERNLVYKGATEKVTNFKIRSIAYFTIICPVNNPLADYVNFKKQRFWEKTVIPPDYKLNSFSLRGPPSC